MSLATCQIYLFLGSNKCIDYSVDRLEKKLSITSDFFNFISLCTYVQKIYIKQNLYSMAVTYCDRFKDHFAIAKKVDILNLLV